MKEYNGEKGIISLTSWKARINTVSRTLVNLMDKCPEFHIVLVLSEEEFPGKMADMPDDIRLLVDAGFFEILWVYKNYRAFKKVLFTMDKYRDVPVISADDDCIYRCNYAKILYNTWNMHRDAFVSCYMKPKLNTFHLGGAATLYPPYVFGEYGIKCLDESIYRNTNQDDDYYTVLRSLMNLNRAICIDSWARNYRRLYVFHDEISPCHNEINHLTKHERDSIFSAIMDKVIALGYFNV